ncbi:hypothetical protein Vafri_18949, partial [Volvox africanus]
GGGGDPNARMMMRRQRWRQQVAQQAAADGDGADAPASTDQPPAQQQQQQQPQQQPVPQALQHPGAMQPPVLPGGQQQQQQQMGLGGIVIPPQVVPQVVPYGSLGVEARMAATGQPPEVPPTTSQHELPEKFKTSRVIGWQEKVYSRSEVAAARAAATTPAGQQAPQPLQQQPQPGPGATASQQQQQEPPPQQQQQQEQQQQQQPAVRSKRLQAFGSQSALDHKRMDPRTCGSILYTFVQTDDFCVVQELGRTVTTSPYEDENVLVSKLLSKPKGRAQVISFRSMYIMADLGEEGDVGASNDKVLVSIRAFPDGSFDMCPGFSRAGLKYRFEDNHGGIFEYTVENASATDIPSLEKRTAKLERAVVARAEELRRAALKTDFEAPPAGECTRLLLFGEILSAADFLRNHLYIEYVVRWDPDVWNLTTPANRQQPQSQPGIAQGVTHISRVTVYPADPATNTPARDVAHFSHPLELEWVSQPGSGPHNNPQPNAYPCLFFQVCTLDKLNRYTSEGYGWLSLDGRVPGSGTYIIRTWKPLGTIRDRQAEFFTGGSPELADLAYVTTPSGFNGKILNKFGFKTETIGAIKVRLHTVTQRFNPDATALAGMRRSWGSTADTQGLGGGDGAGGAAPNKRNLPSKRDLSLKMVVERARQRLREARGTDQLPGGAVAVRPGVVSEAPTIIVHPQDAAVSEDSTVRFKVVARGLPPLTYEWYKDDRRLLVATSDQPELVLVQVSLDSEGAYHCQVSNKDGSASSSKATLTVTRAARVTRTAAGFGPDSSRASRRQQRNSSISLSGGTGLQGPGGGGGGAPRMSRLARLDAGMSTRTAAGGSIAGSDVGGQMSPTQASAGPSPRESTGGDQVLRPGPDRAAPTDTPPQEST